MDMNTDWDWTIYKIKYHLGMAGAAIFHMDKKSKTDDRKEEDKNTIIEIYKQLGDMIKDL